ncbi:DinB family protein [Glaciecola sp. XM2]|jgi:hypothetical protein|uniref:DinB family protein n=1 Tax=Glaciecola sp. XM2 TaxID=1914931 RepID=UPI001BDDDB70|nr:DinB family protein [Glaciecola sp. XM2]MBT1451189.1 DinB family protein [Glaciecola sp. XM2]
MSNSYNAVIEQAIELLQGISPTEYQKILKPHFSGSVGAHIRHVLDHFLALKNGVEKGHVDYNIRHRHNKVEQFPQSAIDALSEIQSWILGLAPKDCEQSLLVTTEIDINHTKSATCTSTLERELVFASSHAIHHYALIRIICGMQNKKIPELFGYAPATITHMQQTNAS